MATVSALNKYGRLPIAMQGGKALYPSPDFQRFLDALVERTGGVDEGFTSADYDTVVGAPVGVDFRVINGAPVSNLAAGGNDSGPLALSAAEIDGAPI